MNISRREAIKLSLAGGGVLLSPFGFPSIASAQLSPQIPRFKLPFKVPPVLKPQRSDDTTDYYEIKIQKSAIEILPGLKTEIWGYNGISPGPTIRQRGGKRDEGGRFSKVRFINQLDKDAQGRLINNVIHLHGMASLPQYDGYTIDYIPPQYFKDYIYPNDRAATLWYHDHTLDFTSRNVYMGLAGMYIVEDDYELNLPLPKGEYDVPLIIQDKRLANDGSLIFNDNNQRNLYGDVILVNGVPWPQMQVANRKYRFRVLNASTSRNYKLILSQKPDTQTSGERLIVIASDAGLLAAPVELVSPLQGLQVGMAERYDIVIDFSKYSIGSQVYLRNVDSASPVDNDVRTHTIMRFDVVRQEQDDSIIPNQLRPVESLRDKPIARTRNFRFERNNGQWKINNLTWDSKRVDANPQPGDVEIWELVNPGSGWVHPVHIHLVDLQLLDRNGLPPRPYERGWKDVFLVGEFETVRVIAQFRSRDLRDIKGKFMMHCHNLVHEDHAMMTQFEIGQGGPNPVTTAPALPISQITTL
ncbi:MAG: multicopper oxidase family protein [Aulosira sp. ZfuVER01]|nr:multicopper oxidase family protein [Aulosira sp. ZfuVER01]MDZ7998992.1 multicopper oxidase family protein [Aulosira sp. DedVER01a]MDZ8051284.1 multicopper oxidase family protein [Aulosira sp. ZfuCHP01]